MQKLSIPPSDRVFTLSMSGKEALPLHAGETVKAEVLHRGGDTTATIKLNNIVLDVQTDIPLQKGDTITLRIERHENTVYLRLAGSAGERADSTRDAALSALDGFDKLGSGTEGMIRLIDLLRMVPEQLEENLPEIDILNRFLLEIEHLTGKTLMDVVRNGGIFFESKLRILALGIEADGAHAEIEAGRIIANDLKASLLRLKDTFLAPAILERFKDTIRPDELIDALNTVLRNIEFFQLQSKLKDSLCFFLPLVWKELKDGEIILRELDQGKPGGRPYSCTINLELERVGKLRMYMLFQGGYIHVSCAAENNNFCRLLQDGAGLLEQRFRASGLRLGNLAVLHQPDFHFSSVHAAGLCIHI